MIQQIPKQRNTVKKDRVTKSYFNMAYKKHLKMKITEIKWKMISPKN